MGWKLVFDNDIARQYKYRRKRSGVTTRVTIFKGDKLVWIEDCEGDSLVYCTTINKKRFKTKSQAFKFAKDWMKKDISGDRKKLSKLL